MLGGLSKALSHGYLINIMALSKDMVKHVIKHNPSRSISRAHAQGEDALHVTASVPIISHPLSRDRYKCSLPFILKMRIIFPSPSSSSRRPAYACYDALRIPSPTDRKTEPVITLSTIKHAELSRVALPIGTYLQPSVLL